MWKPTPGDLRPCFPPLSSLVARLATVSGLIIVLAVGPLRAEAHGAPCTEDAMIVFDASGSMAGNLDQGIAALKPRIDEVRAALAEILPAATRVRSRRPHHLWPRPGRAMQRQARSQASTRMQPALIARPRCTVTRWQDAARDCRGEGRRRA